MCDLELVGVRKYIEVMFFLLPNVNSMCNVVVNRSPDEVVDEHKKGAAVIWALLSLIMSSCESSTHLHEHQLAACSRAPFSKKTYRIYLAMKHRESYPA